MTEKYPYPNHKIPKAIEKEAQIAMSFYPQLNEANIIYKFKKNIKKSTMQARPTLDSLFKSKSKRKYIVLISKKFKISNQEYLTVNMPSEVLIGWIGHELGHILDYHNRSHLELLFFGFKYLFFPSYIREAERMADTYAVINGMGEYILKTKKFILSKTDLSESYKNRIKKYYLSPEEIMVLVEELKQQ